MMDLHELKALANLAQELLGTLENALEIEQMCEFYAATTMAVYWYGNAERFMEALARVSSAYHKPEVMGYINLGG